jgi:hypothetical protein
MNLSEVTQVRLLKEDFKKLPKKDHYKIIFLDKTNFISYEVDLKKIINHIKIDIPNWDESPDYQTITNRFKADSHCLLFYYNNECVGWNWGNKNVCFDWINIYQILQPHEAYVGGFFVTKSANRPSDAGYYNYNMVIDYWFNNMGINKIYGYVDSWNKASIRIILQNNVKFYDYLDKNLFSYA